MGTCSAGFVCAQPWANGTGMGDVGGTAQRYVAGAAAVPNTLAAGVVTATEQLGAVVAPAQQVLGAVADSFGFATSSMAAFTGGRQLIEVPDASVLAGFVCQPCGYGQFCPPGSALPPMGSPAAQL